MCDTHYASVSNKLERAIPRRKGWPTPLPSAPRSTASSLSHLPARLISACDTCVLIERHDLARKEGSVELGKDVIHCLLLSTVAISSRAPTHFPLVASHCRHRHYLTLLGWRRSLSPFRVLYSIPSHRPSRRHSADERERQVGASAAAAYRRLVVAPILDKVDIVQHMGMLLWERSVAIGVGRSWPAKELDKRRGSCTECNSTRALDNHMGDHDPQGTLSD